ncbi:MAG: hypothetical protein E7658_00150 [Ruminococcaceae bacterium]|nr:hypothetical protein [Oscillospiraceae bacterium]
MTGSILKIIAAVTMFIDHAGVILFPQCGWMRIIGRIAFPLYAYCIAEGFRYTRNRLRYFLQIFLLGMGCQIVYTVVEQTIYLGILLTFSLSIVLMAAADGAVKSLTGEKTWLEKIYEKTTGKTVHPTVNSFVCTLLFLFLLNGVWLLTQNLTVDYGFWGVLIPLFAFLPKETWGQKLLFFGGMFALALEQYMGGGFTTQFWSVLAVPILILYNGRPGKLRMKCFFYIFYPAHMVFLYFLSFII